MGKRFSSGMVGVRSKCWEKPFKSFLFTLGAIQPVIQPLFQPLSPLKTHMRSGLNSFSSALDDLTLLSMEARNKRPLTMGFALDKDCRTHQADSE